MAPFTIENENTFKTALSNGLSLFLGAGFSVLANSTDGRPIPVGAMLRDELAEVFDVPGGKEMELPILITIIEDTRRLELRDYLEQRYAVGRFDRRYYCLEKINVRAIFTTNIDDLLYRIYEQSDRYYLMDLDMRGAVYGDLNAIEVVSLHGSICDSERPLRFSGASMATAFRSDPDRWHSLTRRLQKYPMLFWGYSLRDPGTLEALDPDTIRGRAHKDKWIVLTPDAAQPQAQAYYRALGMSIIVADTSEMLDYLESYSLSITETQPSQLARNTKSLFPKEAIPKIGTVPPRPIREFYLGAPPSWYDIYHGNIPRTHHFAKLMDMIHSGRHVVVTGIPGCGKTTLMMQAAAELSVEKHKLVFDYIPGEKADLVINRLQGEPAVIFIDNFADSVGAMERLCFASNVQVIAFDRYYNYDIISHRVRAVCPYLIDVTDLSEHDVQEIVSIIPDAIKSSSVQWPDMAEGSEPSIYEIIQQNVTGGGLRQRYESTMRELESKDPLLLDLFLMISYVYQCRTPVSMDMMLAYVHPEISDYKKVYELLELLQQLVQEYSSTLAEEAQDYFVTRSTIVANTIMSLVPQKNLNRLIKRFHSKVTPYVICRYDIFKRQAFDARLMGKAFPVWEEGMEFYENAFQVDRNPYLRQQGALYLSGKKQHNLAFAWIDEARMMTRGKVFSIVNAHAIILFRANIGFSTRDVEVQRQLKLSMDTLAECYRYDKRKIYHARTFAEQAAEYWDVYGDEVAKSYLNTAKIWLAEELAKTPTDRSVRILLRRINRLLGTISYS